jgi:hypothetical protein
LRLEEEARLAFEAAEVERVRQEEVETERLNALTRE